MTNYQYLTVNELNTYLRFRLETDPDMNDVWVAGELSNFKFYAKGGQAYFNLVDEKAQINCVVYSSFLQNLKFKPENGLLILARGKIKFFHKKGTVVFQVSYMITQGEGVLSQQFELLKQKLIAEGLFDESRKKPLPKYPERVALITALDSAAMWDFVSLSQTLMPSVKLVVMPAVMQGLNCPDTVIAAMDTLDEWAAQSRDHHIDTIVIMRGGGSSEDLAGFNNEDLIRRIADAKIPVVSGIGHEVDYTLTDFVADHRAPTPTAAVHHVAAHYALLIEALPRKIVGIGDIVQEHAENLIMRLEDGLENMGELIQEKQEVLNTKMDTLFHRVEQTNPLRKFRQGYSINRHEETGKIIKSVTDVSVGDQMTAQVEDGRILAKVFKTQPINS